LISVCIAASPNRWLLFASECTFHTSGIVLQPQQPRPRLPSVLMRHLSFLMEPHRLVEYCRFALPRSSGHYLYLHVRGYLLVGDLSKYKNGVHFVVNAIAFHGASRVALFVQ